MHGSERKESAAEKIAEMLSCLEKTKEEPEPNTTHPQAMVATGMGLAALPKKWVEKIKANEYVDFTELSPAKEKSRLVPSLLRGRSISWYKQPTCCKPEKLFYRPDDLAAMFCSIHNGVN